MTSPARLIRDAAACGDFARAAALWKQHSTELDLVQLSELIAAVRNSAARARAQAWVLEAYAEDAGL